MKVRNIILLVILLIVLFFLINTLLFENHDSQRVLAQVIGTNALDNGRYDDGLAACNLYLEKNPDDCDILLIKSKLIYAKGDYLNAYHTLSHFIECGGNMTSADDYTFYGKVCANAGNLQEAVLAYESGLAIYESDPTSSLALLNSTNSTAYKKANILVKLQRYDEAIEIYNEGLKLDPQNTNLLVNLGDAYLYKSLLTSGQIDDMYTALDMTATKSERSNAKVSTSTSIKSHKLAVEAYNTAVAIDPMCYPFVAARIMGGYERSINNFQDILKGANE